MRNNKTQEDLLLQIKKLKRIILIQAIFIVATIFIMLYNRYT